jgi:pantothenate kinase
VVGGRHLVGRQNGRVTPDLEDLTERAAGLLDGIGEERAVLGVVGCPGSGKSTFVDLLVAAVRDRVEGGATSVAHVPMDGFHLADQALDRLGLRRRKGAPETFDAAGYAALLRRVRTETGTTVYAPAFQRDLEQPLAGAIAVPPGTRLVVTEGNYLLLDGPWAAVRGLLSEVWFVQVDEETRVRRLVARHEQFGKTRDGAFDWVRTVDQPNADLVLPTAALADLVVDMD